MPGRCVEQMVLKKRIQLLTCKAQSPEEETSEIHGTYSEDGMLRRQGGGPPVLWERHEEVSAA